MCSSEICTYSLKVKGAHVLLREPPALWIHTKIYICVKTYASDFPQDEYNFLNALFNQHSSLVKSYELETTLEISLIQKIIRFCQKT